jgi:hypothetical protein
MTVTRRGTRDYGWTAAAATEAEAIQVQAGKNKLVGVSYAEHTRFVATTATATLMKGLYPSSVAVSGTIL